VETSHRAGSGGLLHWVSIGLVVVATILLVGANVAYWAQGTLLDSDEFTDKVSGVLDREDATQRVGDVLATQVLSSGDLQDRIAQALPQNAQALPFLLEGELQDVLARTVARILLLEPTQAILDQAIRQLHDLVVSTLEGRRGGLDVENGALVIHLEGAVSNVLNKLGVNEPSALQGQDIGTVVLVSDATTLDDASWLVRAVNTSVPILLVGSVVAFGGSVLAARNKPRGLTVVGYGIIIAAVVSLLAWRLGLLASREFLDQAPVAKMIIESLASNLRVQSFFLVALGIVIVALADARIRGWLTRNARDGWSRVETFGTGRALTIGAVVFVAALLIF